jgi:hypothetical protein
MGNWSTHKLCGLHTSVKEERCPECAKVRTDGLNKVAPELLTACEMAIKYLPQPLQDKYLRLVAKARGES